jgi:hypothetical protein
VNPKQASEKDLLDLHFDRRARDKVHTSFPAEITKIHNRAKVDVKPLVATLRPDGTMIPYGELFDVRIQTYACQDGEVFISLPFKVGDKVWVFVSERDTYDLMSTGNVKATTTATHDLSDCFCILQYFTDKNLPEYSPDDLVIGNKDTTIAVKPSQISVEALSTEFNGKVSVTQEVVSEASVEAPKFITEGQSGIAADIVVGSIKYTFLSGLLIKQGPA